MDGYRTGFVDETVLHTPKPTACSTVHRKSTGIRQDNISLENSLGILNTEHLSNTSKGRIYNVSATDSNYQLKQRHLLANSSLDRANKVAGLPSRYLRPNLSSSSTTNISLTNESTINESDISKSVRNSPRNTSTPRAWTTSNNCGDNNLSRLSLGQSMAQLSPQLRNTDISIDQFGRKFQKAMNSVDKGVAQMNSQVFSPAKETASVLLANEMSGKRKNEISVTNVSKLSHQDISYTKVSGGTFFRQKSNTLSDLKITLSPVNTKNPIPLIDSFAEEPQNEIGGKSNKSLGTSTIRMLLADTEYTPQKATTYLLKQGQKLNENSIDHSSKSFSNSVTSLPDGKLPIESTKTELLWGCVKVDKCVTQEFLLRNKTSRGLSLHMSIAGLNFKLRKDNQQDSKPLSAAKVLLYPYESRSIIVCFIPTKIGAAVGELIFTPTDVNIQHTKKQSVRLFGYGGYGKIDFLNLTEHVTGKFSLSLRTSNNQNVKTCSFIVKNSGTLPCIACINFNAKDLFGSANVSITPRCSVLFPNEHREIVVKFDLTTKYNQVLQQLFANTNVAEIGSLFIISGTEVNRGRLRRQCHKCAEKGLQIDPISNILKEKIKGEAMPSDLDLLKEAPDNLKEILKLFTRNEVVVTIERDREITMRQYADQSGLFHTLCQDSATACLETTTMHVACKLEPSSIVLMPPTKIKDSLFLISECKKMMHFEMVSNPEGLEIVPKEGIVGPGQEIIINITCSKLSTESKELFKVLVYIENEVFEATVKIIFIHSQNMKLH